MHDHFRVTNFVSYLIYVVLMSFSARNPQFLIVQEHSMVCFLSFNVSADLIKVGSTVEHPSFVYLFIETNQIQVQPGWRLSSHVNKGQNSMSWLNNAIMETSRPLVDPGSAMLEVYWEGRYVHNCFTSCRLLLLQNTWIEKQAFCNPW